jgi:superfamily II DNA or RNA helicase
MTNPEVIADPRYTPYQAEFFHKFVAEVGPGTMHLLLAPVGTGKSVVIAGSISELVRTGRLQRVLIIAPGMLATQWAYALSDLGREPALINGQTLRLLREQTGGTANEWPSGIYAISVALARRPDVRELMAVIPWDLVVVDEAHRMNGQRLDLVNALADRRPAPALLLATNVRDVETFAFADRAVQIDWSEAVAEFRSVEEQQTPLVRLTRVYRRSDEEMAVSQQVLSVARGLEELNSKILVQRATSSIRSLEDSLVRWVGDPDRPRNQRTALERLLQQVEDLRQDARLESFTELVRELIGSGARHMVVFCEYRATQEYLRAALDELEIPDYQIHAGMQAEQRKEVLDTFTSDGGLLVITTGASKGVSFNFVGVVIHYDLPVRVAAFAQREGSYHRYGSRQSCRVYILEDESRAFPLETLQIQMAQNVSRNADGVYDRLLLADLEQLPE